MRTTAPSVERGCLFKESPRGPKSAARVAAILTMLMPLTAIIAIRRYWRITRNSPFSAVGNGYSGVEVFARTNRGKRGDKEMKGKWMYPLVLLFYLWGCAASRTFWMDIRYLPGPSTEQAERKQVVAVNDFKDLREDSSTLGAWTRPKGRLDTFMTSKPVDQAVTKAISDYFISRKYRVINYTGWDLSPESLSGIPADLVVGGDIIHLKSEAWTTVRTRVKVHVQLQIHVGKVRERKVLSQKMEISKEIVGVTSRPENIEEALNKELSEAIDRIFQGIL